jgi:hypothetical protein
MQKIAFGMQTDSINDVNNKLNAYLANLMRRLEECLRDPLVKIRFNRLKKARDSKKMTFYLRDVAKKKLYERLEGLERGEPLGDDILSNILRSYSKF